MLDSTSLLIHIITDPKQLKIIFYISTLIKLLQIASTELLINIVEHYVYTAKSFVWGSFRVTSTNL